MALSPLAHELWVKYEFEAVSYISTKCPPAPPGWLAKVTADLEADGWQQLMTDTTTYSGTPPYRVVTETFVRRRV